MDVRENVRFRGGELSRWVNERYRDRGCALAIEFKKMFMDEWTGTVDERHVEELVERLPPRCRAPCRRASDIRHRRRDNGTSPDLDLTVDRALSDIAGSFRFLLDVTPVDLVEARDDLLADGTHAGVPVPPAPDDPA